MMSKEKRRVPKLRFPGFTEDWERRKLTSFTQRVKGNDGRMDLPTLTISASEGWLNQKDRFSANIAGSEQKNYTLLRQGELSYNHGNSKLAKYGVVYALQEYKEALVPRVYHSFKVDESYDALFVEYYFSTKRPDRELRKLISSGARMDGLLNIGYDEFTNISISLPTFSEQKQIVALLKVCVKNITVHQRKIEHLNLKKKALLQKLFPKNGECYPEHRFPGFTDAWEQCKLGSLATVEMNKRIFKEQTTTKGDIPFYKIGTFGCDADSFISRDLFEEYKNKYPYPNIGDILISASGSIGRTVVYNGEDAYYQDSNIVWLNHNGKIDNSFLLQFYNQVKWAGLEGSTIKRLYNKNILETYIAVPKIEEQRLIGEFFKLVDSSITLHQRKLEHLQLQKKALLQQLFI